MTDFHDVFIVSGAGTTIGTFGGFLASFRPEELGALVIREAIAHAGVTANQVQIVMSGTVIPTQPKDAYAGRIAAVVAGIPVSALAMNPNRFCRSGLQAIYSAAQGLNLREHDVAVAGGVESMTNAPHMVLAARNGQRMGNIEMVDAMLGALHDPFENIHMGATAENVSDRCAISRQDQDAAAVKSHRHADAAIANGYFNEQTVPTEIKTPQGVTIFDKDEHVRANASIEGLAALSPVFKKGGPVTAGNAYGIHDGAGAVVLAIGKAVGEQVLKPPARILSWGHAGVELSLMWLGPVKAVPLALKRVGLTLDEMDVIEADEGFAAQACDVAKQLSFDPAKTNPNGSGISPGHPIGATGAILTIKPRMSSSGLEDAMPW